VFGAEPEPKIGCVNRDTLQPFGRPLPSV